jgi:peptidoglycan/xylan/chitin deacetylase (PgdA/CDA1 family)
MRMAGEQKSGGLTYWLRRRRASYIVARIGKLLTRYGIRSGKAKRRTMRFVKLLATYDCAPTLATPGGIVAKHPAFMRELRDAGVELAIHGFDHVDFRSLTREDAHRQFARASTAYADAGIPFKGFRCPYLSYSHDMSELVPDGLVAYSSNEAVWWDVVADDVGRDRTVIFDSLADFYRAAPAEASLVLPRTVGRLVEIPVSLPDDLQLLDGLRAGDVGVRDAWVTLLRQSHERGSVFVVLFHPESFDLCKGALEGLLAEARTFDPPVWVARLGDVGDWWRELESFSAHVVGPSVELDCSDRATVLARGSDLPPGRSWADGYRVLEGRTVDIGTGPRPFVGLPAAVPAERVAVLRSLGYIVEHGEKSAACAVRLDPEAVGRCANDRELVQLVDGQEGSLVRYWHWPAGARSALCITGDLDGLSLLDYASRVITL